MTLMSSPLLSSANASRDSLPIEQAVRSILVQLQTALNAVITELPDHVTRAVDLERGLGLDKKLGWRLFKFVSAADPLMELDSVPGVHSMRRILNAGTRRGVAKETTSLAAAAFARFESFVAEHGGDRADLISLASGLVPNGRLDVQHECKVRKSLFKGNAHVWGIRADHLICNTIIRASGTDTYDILGIRADIGLQRLRRNIPLTMNQGTRNGAAGQYTGHDQSGGLRILEDFSSRPLPEMQSRIMPDGTFETDVIFPPSGRTGAVTLYGARHIATASTSIALQSYQQSSTVRIPCEKLVCELLVPQGWSDPATVRVTVYGRRDQVDGVKERRTADLLPQRETALYLGTMETAPAIPGVPQHPQAVYRALSDIGWQGTLFDVYRCEVDYPILHTMISLDVDAAKG